MALNVNGVAMDVVKVNGVAMDVVKVNGVIVWEAIQKILVSDGNVMVDSTLLNPNSGSRGNDPDWGLDYYNYGVNGANGQTINQSWWFTGKYKGRRFRMKFYLCTANRSGAASNGWYMGDTKMGETTHNNRDLITEEFTLTENTIRLNAMCRDDSSSGGYQYTRVGIHSLEVID